MRLLLLLLLLPLISGLDPIPPIPFTRVFEGGDWILLAQVPLMTFYADRDVRTSTDARHQPQLICEGTVCDSPIAPKVITCKNLGLTADLSAIIWECKVVDPTPSLKLVTTRLSCETEDEFRGFIALKGSCSLVFTVEEQREGSWMDLLF